jgi:hypothetical protein
VTAGAFGAHSDTAFNRWIGWATGDLIISSDSGDLTAIAAAVSRHIEIEHP